MGPEPDYYTLKIEEELLKFDALYKHLVEEKNNRVGEVRRKIEDLMEALEAERMNEDT